MNIHKGTFILVSGAYLKCFSIKVRCKGTYITRTCKHDVKLGLTGVYLIFLICSLLHSAGLGYV